MTMVMMVLLSNNKGCHASLQVGDTVCVEGFIMDRFCIDLGTLFDNRSVETLIGPQEHSVHCLVDVGSCIRSEFELLLDPPTGETMYIRGFELTTTTKDNVVALARDVGTSCSTCTGSGELVRGFRAAMIGTVQDLQEGSGNPPLFEATDMAHSNGFNNPCSELFPEATGIMTLEELLASRNSTIAEVDAAKDAASGGGSSGGSNNSRPRVGT